MKDGILTEGMTVQDWLKARRKGIGSSDVAAILGINPYKSSYQVWKEKVSDDEPEEVDNKFTHWGKLLEDPTAQTYEKRTGKKVFRDNQIRVHPEYDFLIANLDRIIEDQGDGRGVGILECKSTVGYVFKSWMSDNESTQFLPLEYYCQVQHQLAVTGWQWAEVAVLVLDEREVNVIPIVRDDEFINKMVEALVKWWNAYVIPNVPPPMTTAEYSFVEPQEDSFIEANGEIAELYRNLLDKKKEQKRLDEEIKGMEDKIKEFIGDKENLVLIDTVIASWKQQKRTTVDSKKLQTEQPEIYQAYSKTSKFRVLRLKDIN